MTFISPGLNDWTDFPELNLALWKDDPAIRQQMARINEWGRRSEVAPDPDIQLGLILDRIVGPATSTLNALVVYADTSGVLAKDSVAILDGADFSGIDSIDINDTIVVDGVFDEDDMVSDSATGLATQQSIKKFVDTLESLLATCVIDGGNLTVNGGDPAKFDISDGNGRVYDAYTDPNAATFIDVAWSGLTAQTPAHGLVSFIGINSSGVVVQQATDFTPSQTRTIIVLGVVGAAGGVIVSLANETTSRGEDYLEVDLARALGRITTSGNTYSANGANLQVDLSAGETFEHNLNIENDVTTPHVKNHSGEVPVTAMFYVYSDGAGSETVVAATVIDPDQYDDLSGVLQTVSNNKWTNQIMYFFPDSETRIIQYGQEQYNSLARAEAAVLTLEWISIAPTLQADAIRTVLSVKKGETDLTSADTVFTNTGKFGFGTAGGNAPGGTFQDLQATYNNSITPEILTDSTRGAVSFKRGSGADTDDVFEVLDGSDVQVASITGDGDLDISGDLVLLGDIDTTRIKTADASAANTAIGPSVDIDTGIYWATSSLRIAFSGNEAHRFGLGTLNMFHPTDGINIRMTNGDTKHFDILHGSGLTPTTTLRTITAGSSLDLQADAFVSNLVLSGSSPLAEFQGDVDIAVDLDVIGLTTLGDQTIITIGGGTGQTAVANADDFVVDVDALNGGMSVLVDDDKLGTYYIGSVSDDLIAFYQAKFSTLVTQLGSHVVGMSLQLFADVGILGATLSGAAASELFDIVNDLDVGGDLDVTGNVDAVAGTFTGAVSGTAGTFTGVVSVGTVGAASTLRIQGLAGGNSQLDFKEGADIMWRLRNNNTSGGARFSITHDVNGTPLEAFSLADTTGDASFIGEIDTAEFYTVDGVQVLSNSITGFAAATGTATRTTFVTSTVTTEQLAQRVMALLEDLATHGLIKP